MNIKIAAYYSSTMPESFRVYVDNIIVELKKIGVEVIRFTNTDILPRGVDLYWDTRSGGGHPPLNTLRYTRQPFVITVHGVAPLAIPLYEYFPGWRQAIIGKIDNLKKVYAWSTFKSSYAAIIAVSRYGKLTIEKHLKLDPNKIYVCYHGVNHSIFYPSENIENGEYYLHISNDEPRKNVDRIIEAYQSIPDKGKQPLVLKLPPDTTRKSSKNVYIIRNRLSDEEIANLYRGATAFLFPSLYEGFGLPILEAKASGCPVITANNNACTEIASGAALLVNPRSIDQIATAIERIQNESELRRKLIQQGIAHAREFTWYRSAQQHYTVFRKILDISELAG